MSVRKALGAALLGMWGMLSGCSLTLDQNSGARQLFDTYERSMENRARSRLRDNSQISQFVYAAHDPFIYDSVMRDGLTGATGDAIEQQRIDDVRSDVYKLMRRSGVDTAKVLLGDNAGKTLANLVTPDQSLEEAGLAPRADGANYVLPTEPKQRKPGIRGNLLTPRVGLNREEMRGKIEVFNIASGTVVTDHQGELLKYQATLNMQIIDELTINGRWEKDIEDDTKTWTFGARYKGWGTWIEVLPDDKRVWFGYGY